MGNLTGGGAGWKGEELCVVWTTEGKENMGKWCQESLGANSEYWYRCGWPLIHGTAGRSTGSAPADRLAARCVASGGGRGGEGGDVSPTSRAMEKLVDDLTGGGGVTGGVLSSLTDVDVVDVATGLSSSVMFSDECDELALSGRTFLHPFSVRRWKRCYFTSISSAPDSRLTCGIVAQLPLLDSQLSVLPESFSERVVVDLELRHPIVLHHPTIKRVKIPAL